MWRRYDRKLYFFRSRNVEKPTYLDIGANDPYFLSNTAFFYEKGCRGVNVDANPVLIEKFRSFRPGDINLNVGVGPEKSYLDFYIFNEPTLSTFSREEAENMERFGKYKIEKIEKINLITVDNIVSEYCNGKFPDFLSLDVEGLDFEILKSIGI